MNQSASTYVEAATAALAALRDRADAIDRIADRLVKTLRDGNKILTCGNGGSAAEAMHLAEEMIGRYRRQRRPLAALCVNSDPTAMTCIANDWDYAEVFARQIEGLARRGDALVVLSTSGKSPSILQALERARRQGLTTIGLLGPVGSPAEAHCDDAVTFETNLAASHVQEAHIVVIHALLERFDREFA